MINMSTCTVAQAGARVEVAQQHVALALDRPEVHELDARVSKLEISSRPALPDESSKRIVSLSRYYLTNE